MTLRMSHLVIAVFVTVFLTWIIFLLFVQQNEVHQENSAEIKETTLTIPKQSEGCVDCHKLLNPAIIDHWKSSKHAIMGVGCVDCHQANKEDADDFEHAGYVIATIVTPKDCGSCHIKEAQEFEVSHHSKAGNILASLDNFLAETVEGSRLPFNPHSPTPGMDVQQVNGMASAFSGCQQCHGSKVGFQSKSGGIVTVDDLKPDKSGKPTNQDALSQISYKKSGKPILHASTWPNTGIGRLNLDGSKGSCSACHSRHDFSPRRARQPENCGKCHLGPDHPQKEIYEESKHGVAYRDLKAHMNLDAETWILGKDYTQAPTCATCHMSGHSKNNGEVTHDPGERISWTNRPPVSLRMDTDAEHKIVTETDPKLRETLIKDKSTDKRNRMSMMCSHCHSPDYISAFYTQYDDLVVLYNEKFAKPGQAIMASLRKNNLITATQFDEEIEWIWFYLWHHEGRRARHGASMMAPDYTHWHGMFEVAERFYMELIPQAFEIVEHAGKHGKSAQAAKTKSVIEGILDRPEHLWLTKGAAADAARIRKAMEERYGKSDK